MNHTLIFAGGRFAVRGLLLVLCAVPFLFPRVGLARVGRGTCCALSDSAQNVRPLTREDIMGMGEDDLYAIDLDVLMDLANREGVSVEALMELAMNRKTNVASRKSESAFTAPLATYVISQQDIKNSGYTNIPELFNLVPGVFVRQKTNGNYDVTFHGMNNIPPENPMLVRENSTMLLMIDNRVVYDQFSGAIFWEALPICINDIERIDIIVGAASALYGSNAMTGVINIVTLKKAVRAGAQAYVAVGMHAKRDAGVNLHLPLSDAWGTRFTGFVQHADRFQTDYYSYPFVEELPIADLRSYQMKPLTIEPWSMRQQKLALMRYGGTANLYYQPHELFHVRLSGGGQYSQAQTSAYNNLVTPLNFRSSQSAFAGVSLTYSQLHLQSSVRSGNFNLDEGKRTPFNTSFNTFTADALVNGDFNVGYGISFQPELSVRYTSAEDAQSMRNFDPKDPTSYPRDYMRGKQTLTNAAAGMRMEYKPLEALRFIGGVRYDRYSEIQRSALSYQLVGVYSIGNNHLLRANYSQATRGLFHSALYASVLGSDGLGIPIMNTNYDIYDQGIRYPGAKYVSDFDLQYLAIEGNTELEAATLDLYEVGYRAKFSSWLQMDLSIFYQEMRNIDAPDVEIAVRFKSPKDPNFDELHDVRKYQNLSLVARQGGATLSFTSIPIDMLTIRAHVTGQHTWLNDYNVLLGSLLLTDRGVGTYLYEKMDFTHSSTPTLFGGLNVNLSPLSNNKLNIQANLQWRTNQITFYAKVVHDSHPFLIYEVPTLATLDLSVSYKLLPGLTAYALVQNIGKEQVQYAYNDRVRLTALGGLRFDF